MGDPAILAAPALAAAEAHQSSVASSLSFSSAITSNSSTSYVQSTILPLLSHSPSAPSFGKHYACRPRFRVCASARLRVCGRVRMSCIMCMCMCACRVACACACSRTCMHGHILLKNSKFFKGSINMFIFYFIFDCLLKAQIFLLFLYVRRTDQHIKGVKWVSSLSSWERNRNGVYLLYPYQVLILYAGLFSQMQEGGGSSVQRSTKEYARKRRSLGFLPGMTYKNDKLLIQFLKYIFVYF